MQPGVGGKLNLDLKQVESHLRRELSRRGHWYFEVERNSMPFKYVGDGERTEWEHDFIWYLMRLLLLGVQ